MKFKEFIKSILEKEQIKNLYSALRCRKVIIIKGIQGPTGKTTLKKILQKKGYTVYEEDEIVELELNKVQKNPIHDLEDNIEL